MKNEAPAYPHALHTTSTKRDFNAGRLTLRRSPRFAEWHIKDDDLIAPNGNRFQLIRHGLDKYTASLLARECTVVRGEYPELSDVTDEPTEVEDLLAELETTGALFTVFASVYRRRSRTVLLLDYLR
jgi:hypothetical protein